VLDMLRRLCALTRREAQLVGLVVAGLSTRELAAALFISQYTVKDHLKAVFDKVGVRSRRELIREVMGSGLTATRLANAG
jgi:DNA-binding CsgD family transcriptional regulator